MLYMLLVICSVTVMEMYNDKLVDTGGDMTMDTVTTESNPIMVPVIKDITRDENFVDVSCIVCVHICVCISVCVGVSRMII